MSKLVLSSNLKIAITTPAYANEYGLASPATFIFPGKAFIKKILVSYVSKEYADQQQKQRYRLVNNALSTRHLEKVFESVKILFCFKPLITNSTRKSGGMTSKMKVRMLCAICYAAVLDNRQDVLDHIKMEVRKGLVLENNYLLKFNNFIKDQEIDIKDQISVEKFSGTDDKPIFKACLSYRDITVEAIGKNKRTARERACEKFFLKYEAV